MKNLHKLANNKVDDLKSIYNGIVKNDSVYYTNDKFFICTKNDYNNHVGCVKNDCEIVVAMENISVIITDFESFVSFCLSLFSDKPKIFKCVDFCGKLKTIGANNIFEAVAIANENNFKIKTIIF